MVALLRALIVILVVGLLAPVSSHAAFWDVSPIADDMFAAGDASLAIDGAGTVRVSYTASGGVYLASRVVGGWNIELVANAGYGGGWTAIALNPSSGQPCIAFIDRTSETAVQLKFAHKPSTAWVIETVDTALGEPDYVSLAFNASGQACIAYCKTTDTNPSHTYVCFARRIAPNSWAPQTIAEIGSITGPSMYIDSADTTWLTFADSTSGQLKIASGTGLGPWQVQGIDGGVTNPVIGYTSVAQQPGEGPAVAYFRASSDGLTLKYARRQGMSWATEPVVDVANEGAYHCSLAIRRGQVPLIAYHDPTDMCLKCASKSAPSWRIEVVDPALLTGFRPSLKLDSVGSAHVAYVDCFWFNVKYAWSPTPIQDAKLLRDGDPVQISAVAASSATGELAPRIYVQDFERTCGIQLYFTGTMPSVARGTVLDIRGALTTIDGERAIINPTVEEIGVPVTPAPLALTNKAVGGGDFRYSSGPPATGQRGITGAVGLNNIGLLVTIWGEFSYVDSSTFTVDDGSGVPVKCIVPSGVALNPNWDYVSVTGISSCELADGELHRLLRVRAASDIIAR